MNTISKTPTLQHNRELAEIFRRMSQCYQYLGVDDRFRAIAYDRASKTLRNLEDPVDAHADSIRSLDELPGVGERIAEKILEYLHSGKIATYEKLRKKVPFELLELLEIEGIGPATIRLLHDEAHIHDRDQLIAALTAGKLDGIIGLAGKKLEHIRQVLKVDKPVMGRMPLGLARKTGQSILKELEKIRGLQQITLAGSLRREQETVGDIDIVGVSAPADRRRIINRFVHIPQCQRVLARGDTKASIILTEPDVQADLRLVNEDEFGSALLYFTGSKEHNIALRMMAKKKGWKLNEYGLFDAKGMKMAGRTEEEVYKLFGLPYIPPQQRLGKQELEGAQ
jgi:DNA polymerase (family 10)